MDWKDLKPKRESIKYRDSYGRLLELKYIVFFGKYELFKKTVLLEDICRK